MNDYIARLREKYDDHFGCAPSIVLDCVTSGGTA